MKPSHLSIEEFCHRTGACSDGARDWLSDNGGQLMTEPVAVSLMNPEYAEFMQIGNGDGDGDGNGNGDGYGYGYGYGDGNGYGYGYGDGYGDGYGYGGENT
jgi:hypothetical protein